MNTVTHPTPHTTIGRHAALGKLVHRAVGGPAGRAVNPRADGPGIPYTVADVRRWAWRLAGLIDNQPRAYNTLCDVVDAGGPDWSLLAAQIAAMSPADRAWIVARIEPLASALAAEIIDAAEREQWTWMVSEFVLLGKDLRQQRLDLLGWSAATRTFHAVDLKTQVRGEVTADHLADVWALHQLADATLSCYSEAERLESSVLVVSSADPEDPITAWEVVDDTVWTDA